MNRKLYFLIGIIFFALFLMTAFEKAHIEEHMERLEDKSEELEKAKDFEKKIGYLDETNEIEWDIEYHEWADAREQAEALKKESDGRFELDWGTYLIHQAKKKNINPALVFELLNVETGGKFDPELVGPPTKYGKAYGMAQFMKNTGPWIAKKADMPYSHSLLFDPFYSIQLSIEYLDYLYEKYDNWDKALTAYHRGVGGLKAYEDKHGNAKSWYAEEIQEKADKKEESLANN
ncbi:lytic transglycosylase domain-containing protein [Alteribacillus sp. JSM 102045]|uniref:lytic transglycosylase domain-containing protein n=1 Tax=Alteribacillus sp. JSM 102045 TaxID=1562101 RepID=UPI0035C2267E